LDAVLDALCEGIDALDPDLMSSVLLADPDGQRLWPAAGPRVPEDYKQLISPLPIASAMAACGTAAYRKERVISQPRAPAHVPGVRANAVLRQLAEPSCDAARASERPSGDRVSGAR